MLADENPMFGPTLSESNSTMGDTDAKRDWGFAGDYVRAMQLMLQQDQAQDFVIGTGETHSVQEFIDLAFARAGLDAERYVRTDPQFIRSAEVDLLLADPTKARTALGWTPEVSFQGLVDMMVDNDLARVEPSRLRVPWLRFAEPAAAIMGVRERVA